MSSNLWKNINYKSNCDYLTSTFIREYDISKANINILFYKNIINLDQYNEYINMDKMKRQVSIGYMIKSNPKIYQIISSGIIEAKKMFFEANNIEDNDVLSIKNDAIFIINKAAKFTKFANIEFVQKNIYTSFYILNKIEYYYFYDNINDIEKLDIKGLGDEVIVFHKDYFYEFLCVIFNSAQIDTIDETINIISSFYDKYIHFKLDVQYYRRFDYTNTYDMKDVSEYSKFRSIYISENNKYDLDISFNAKIISELYKIFVSIYFRKKQ